MDFMKFFDIHNKEHLAAYKHLSVCGAWPVGFIPEDCKMSPVWPYQIAEKMAVAYVNLVLNNK